MVAQFNKSLGIKEESKRQFEGKKERDKSIGKVDVIDLETGNKELKRVIRDSNRLNLNLFDDDISIKLAIDRGELDEIYNTLKDLINGEIIKPTPNNKNIRYYKDQINIIEDYFYYQNFNPEETSDMEKEDRFSSTLRNTTREADKRTDFLKEIRTPPKQRRSKRNKYEPKSPLVERIPDKSQQRDRLRGRPPSKKGTPGDELIIEKINESEFMKTIPSEYKSMNDLYELQNYWNDAEKVSDNIRKIEDGNLRRKTEKRYDDRYKAIQFRSDDLENQERDKRSAMESKTEISTVISGKGMKRKTPTKKKSNNKSLGKQELIYYLLSQRAGNNNKLMKKRLKENKK